MISYDNNSNILTYKQNQTFLNSTIKPLSHWDAMSSWLFCKSIRETVAKVLNM